jgi:glycosyltransferase involved in cell wall biosynthesis
VCTKTADPSIETWERGNLSVDTAEDVFRMRLLVVSHVTHYEFEGACYAYSPYAREMEIWADLFSEIVIAAPCHNEPPPPNASRIARCNVRIACQQEVGGTTWLDKLGIVAALPSLIFALCREMWYADAIHVRCPGNLGLLGILLAPVFSERTIAKYAGQWSGYPGEAWSVGLQRWLLRSRWWRGPVTVYGKQEGERENITNFFSSTMSTEQLAEGRAMATRRRLQLPLKVAFAGRLTKAKNVDRLIQAIAALKGEGLILQGLIIGDGPQRNALQDLAETLEVREQIEFAGAVPSEVVPELLAQAQVFTLISDSEGWPKALSEAMAFGCVCIGSDRGLIPEFLSEGRGITIPPQNVAALTEALRKIAADPGKYEEMRARACNWAQGYSIENLREGLRALITDRWHLSGAWEP